MRIFAEDVILAAKETDKKFANKYCRAEYKHLRYVKFSDCAYLTDSAILFRIRQAESPDPDSVERIEQLLQKAGMEATSDSFFIPMEKVAKIQLSKKHETFLIPAKKETTRYILVTLCTGYYMYELNTMIEAEEPSSFPSDSINNLFHEWYNDKNKTLKVGLGKRYLEVLSKLSSLHGKFEYHFKIPSVPKGTEKIIYDRPIYIKRDDNMDGFVMPMRLE